MTSVEVPPGAKVATMDEALEADIASGYKPNKGLRDLQQDASQKIFQPTLLDLVPNLAVRQYTATEAAIAGRTELPS